MDASQPNASRRRWIRWRSKFGNQPQNVAEQIARNGDLGHLKRDIATLDGRRILYNIGKIAAASAWHPENSEPLLLDWRQLILRELGRKAEAIGAGATIEVDYQHDGEARIDETGGKLNRVAATGIAVKVSCAV